MRPTRSHKRNPLITLGWLAALAGFVGAFLLRDSRKRTRTPGPRPALAPRAAAVEEALNVYPTKPTRPLRRAAALASVVALVGLASTVQGWDNGSRELESLAESAYWGDTMAAIGGHETSETAEAALRFRTAVFKIRPTPTPPPSPTPTPTPTPMESEVQEEEEVAVAAPPAPAGSITEIIYAAADEYGVDRGYLLSIAQCESGLNPRAVNPAGYYGLFQYHPQTWEAHGYGSIWDPVAQSRTTARLIAAGNAGMWGCA